MAASVPLHWDIHGNPDRWGSKAQVALGGPLLVLAIWALFVITARIDPRRPGLREGGRETVYSAILAMLAALHLVVLGLSTGLLHDATRAITAFVGVLFVVLGNYLGKVKPNWFAGIRTPWTLSNDEVWRRTNRLGGKAFVVAGVVVVVLSFVASGAVLGTGVLVLAVLAAGVPAVYSYVLYRQLARA